MTEQTMHDDASSHRAASTARPAKRAGSRAHAADAPPLPSERSFGWLFVVVFALGGGYALYKSVAHAQSIATGLWIAAAVLAVVTMVVPHWLAAPNRAWFALGHALGRIVSPIVLGVIFFVLIAPIALAMRLAGRDALQLKRAAGRASYWRVRTPAGPDPQSYRNQF